MPTAMLKRFACPTCGAVGALSPVCPFVQCGSCGTVTDYDLGIARRHPDYSRHEALQHELLSRNEKAITAARVARDRETWVELYRAIFETLLEQFPALYPSRVSEPAYRDALLSFQSESNGNLVFAPELQRTAAALSDSMRDTRRDEHGWQVETLWPMFDLAMAHFAEQDRLMEACPPPPDFAPGWMRRMGASLTAQEWLPRLFPEAQRELVLRLGVERDYVMPSAHDHGHCAGCGEELETGEICRACKSRLDVPRGGFACQTCGVTVYAIENREQVVCPYCAAELRESRMGLVARERTRQLFGFIDSELALIRKVEPAPIEAVVVLDGPVIRRELPWRMVSLRAVFATAPSRAFFENTDAPDATSHRDVDAWIELQGVPQRRFSYSEHPRCLVLPESVEEIATRIEDVGGATAIAQHHGPGWAIETEVAGCVVRVVCDEQGERAALYDRWRRS